MLKKKVVFIHGAGGSRQVWENQLSYLEGHDLLALDLPGHGFLSNRPALNSIKGYSEFLEETLKEQKVIVVGHSMGGAIAMEFALSKPECIEGLVLISTGARLRVNPDILNALEQNIHPLNLIRFLYAPSASAALIEQATKDMQNTPTEVYLADFQACDRFNHIDRVSEITAPTLIICGSEDQMTPVKYSEFLHQNIPHSTLNIISGAGHMCMLERPKAVNEAISNFLKLNNLNNQ